MKLAVTGILEAKEDAPLVFRGEYKDIIPKAAEIGYDAMELHIYDSLEIDRPKLKSLFEENGIKLSSIGTGSAYARDRLSLASDDPNIRKQAINRIKDHIVTAKDYGAVVIIGLIKGLVSECRHIDSYMLYLKNSLTECLNTAEEKKVILGLELLNRYESENLNTIEEGLSFIDEVGSDYLKLHLDTYHMNIEERNCAKSIYKAKGKIGHVHIADSDRWYAGHGHYDFRETIKALKEVGYEGALSVESFQYPTPEKSAKYSYEYLKAILDSLN
jgi:5-keto-L-gluconate epimerase